mgnify:CR=1 FL=1
MAHPVNDHALDVIFRDARSHNGFTDKSVPEVLVRAVYDLAKMGPTSANCSPARFVWVTTDEGKKRLAPHMSADNHDKTLTAPWTCIIAYDQHFQEKIPALFPHAPGAKDWFNSNRDPMSGFDADGVNAEFFQSQDGEMNHWRANFICNIGHGDKSKLFDRSPRLDFDEACRIL